MVLGVDNPSLGWMVLGVDGPSLGWMVLGVDGPSLGWMVLGVDGQLGVTVDAATRQNYYYSGADPGFQRRGCVLKTRYIHKKPELFI